MMEMHEKKDRAKASLGCGEELGQACHEEKAEHCHEDVGCHCHEEASCGCGEKPECHCHEDAGCHCHESNGCGCGCDHGNTEESETRTMGMRILLSGLIWIIGMLIPMHLLSLCLHLAAYLIIGYDLLWRALRGILRGRMLDEHFLMSVASIGAILLGEQSEAVAVLLFYQVGELLQDLAVGKSRASIASLMDIRPDHANLELDGMLKTVKPEEVAVGSVILVRPGEKIPLDGVIIEGESTLDTAALTGESLPRSVFPGQIAPSGCVNQSAPLRIRVSAPYGESTVAKILKLVEDSERGKAKTERFITRFARIYTPAVVGAALLLAVIPSLFDGQWGMWIERALLFLVVSCPCALVVSVPLSFFGGIGGASRQGILIKGAQHLEALTKIEIAALDKTGTLTEGRFSVTRCLPAEGIDSTSLLEIAAYAESRSLHPIARSIVKAWGGQIEKSRLGRMEEHAGKGVTAVIDGEAVTVGNRALMAEHGIVADLSDDPTVTAVFVSRDGRYLGTICLSDTVKETAAEGIADLKRVGVKNILLLTGDREEIARAVAEKTGIDALRAGLLPQEKAAAVRELKQSGAVMFVGDGINDAPVIKEADVGVAMGAMGSDAAIEAADVVLMDDDPQTLALAIRIARKTMAIVKQNIVFSLGVKGAVMLLGALGIATMWMAVFADVGVTAIAVLNALRTLPKEKSRASKRQ